MGESGVGVVDLGDHAERQFRVLDRFTFGYEFFRDHHHVIEVRVGCVGDGEFVETVALGVVAGLAFIEAEGEFLLPQTGDELSDEQRDETDVGQPDAGFFGGQFETIYLSADQIGEQKTADEVTSGENRNRDIPDVPQDEQRVKILLLHGPDAEVHLIKGRDKNENDGQGEQYNREL